VLRVKHASSFNANPAACLNGSVPKGKSAYFLNAGNLFKGAHKKILDFLEDMCHEICLPTLSPNEV